MRSTIEINKYNTIQYCDMLVRIRNRKLQLSAAILSTTSFMSAVSDPRPSGRKTSTVHLLSRDVKERSKCGCMRYQREETEKCRGAGIVPLAGAYMALHSISVRVLAHAPLRKRPINQSINIRLMARNFQLS